MARTTLDDDDARRRTVVGDVHHHRAQRPKGDVTDTRWRCSPMNRGRDPSTEGPDPLTDRRDPAVASRAGRGLPGGVAG